jgi:hypothetical protein
VSPVRVTSFRTPLKVSEASPVRDTDVTRRHWVSFHRPREHDHVPIYHPDSNRTSISLRRWELVSYHPHIVCLGVRTASGVRRMASGRPPWVPKFLLATGQRGVWGAEPPKMNVRSIVGSNNGPNNGFSQFCFVHRKFLGNNGTTYATSQWSTGGVGGGAPQKKGN